MTAKHRRGKNNHKHEDNFFKNDVIESEANGGAGNYALLLLLSLVIVVGGCGGAWLFLQQQQTLGQLTESITAMQMKIVKLQSSHEEMRQANGKHLTENVENRLLELEESFATTQKQVGVALATTEQLKTSDLPAQVLSLQTELESRLAETLAAMASAEQLGQVQVALVAKGEELEEVQAQVGGLAALGGELSLKLEALTGSLGEAESKVQDGAGQVTTLSTALVEQAAEVMKLSEQVVTQEAGLKAAIEEVAAVRAFLEDDKSQQAGLEEQLGSVHQSLQTVTSDLRVQLEVLQRQVAQLTHEEGAAVEEEAASEAAATEEETAAPEEEEETTQTVEVEAAVVAKEEKKEALPKVEEAKVKPLENPVSPQKKSLDKAKRGGWGTFLSLKTLVSNMTNTLHRQTGSGQALYTVGCWCLGAVFFTLWFAL